MMIVLVAVLAVVLQTMPADAAGPALGPRQELTVAEKAHEAHVSAPAVAVRADGRIVLAWFGQQGHDNYLFVARPGSEAKPVRVNPDGLFVDSLHQPPGLALGPDGEIYVSWSSRKPLPEGVLFASDLRLSRSLDGGQTFEPPLRVNEDRPISHSFEGTTVARDGAVVMAWIDSREGPEKAATCVARVLDEGTRPASSTRLDDDT